MTNWEEKKSIRRVGSCYVEGVFITHRPEFQPWGLSMGLIKWSKTYCGADCNLGFFDCWWRSTDLSPFSFPKSKISWCKKNPICSFFFLDSVSDKRTYSAAAVVTESGYESKRLRFPQRCGVNVIAAGIAWMLTQPAKWKQEVSSFNTLPAINHRTVRSPVFYRFSHRAQALHEVRNAEAHRREAKKLYFGSWLSKWNVSCHMVCKTSLLIDN